MKTVAIHQPNYAPWCGFFAKIRHCDTFIFLDDVQMPRGRSMVHRTKTMDGDKTRWLSVPCYRSAEVLINQVLVTADPWAAKHVKSLQMNYARAPHLDEIMELIEDVYAAPSELLAEFNMRLIKIVAEHLSLEVDYRLSSSLPSRGSGEERVVSLVQAVGGDRYLSGPGGNAYQSEAVFAQAGIDLQVREYTPRVYAQVGHVDFTGGLSILDALFHCGRGTQTLLSYEESL